MPELPDVERARSLLTDHIIGEAIDAIDVLDSGIVRNRTPRSFTALLRGRTFERVERAGKWLTLSTDGPMLLAHFGMTGTFVWEARASGNDRFDRVIFHMASGELAFRDVRKLRGLWIASTATERSRIIGPQGPDALGLSNDALITRLAGRRGVVKAALMDQSVIAGVGNMLSDEVLWRAHVHPARSVPSLAPQELRAIGNSLRRTLEAGVRAGCVPRRQGWLSEQRGVTEPRCPRGHGRLQVGRVAGRTTYWCPLCQSEP